MGILKYTFLLCLSGVAMITCVRGQARWNLNQRLPATFGIINANIQSLKFSQPVQSNASFTNPVKLADTSKKITAQYIKFQSDLAKSKNLDSVELSTTFSKLTAAFLAQTKDSKAAANAAMQFLDTSTASSDVVRDSAENRLTNALRADTTSNADTLALEKSNWLQADEFAHAHPDKVKNYLELFSKSDTSVTNQLMDIRSKKPMIRSITYILMTLQDTSGENSEIKDYFKSIRALGGTPDDSADIQIKINDIKTIVSTLTVKDVPHFNLFAGGDFLSTIKSNPTSDNNNILSGSIGINYIPNDKIALTARVVLASNQDTVINNYGSQLLSPAKGKGFGTGIVGFNYIFKRSTDKNRTWALNATLAASSQHWRLDSSQLNNIDTVNTKMDSTFIRASTIVGLDITAVNAIAITDSIPVGNAKYALCFSYNLGFAERILGGDVLQPLKNKYSILNANRAYVDRFPTTRKFFFGFEGGTTISLGPVTADFELYYFPSSSKDIQPIAGLTGLQVAFGAAVNISVFSK